MKRIRRITAITAVTLLVTGGTVAYADDETPDTTTTTETTVPAPVVTIKVEDVPATTEAPAPTAAPTTDAPPAPESTTAETKPAPATTDPNLEQMPTVSDDGGTPPAGSMVSEAPTTTAPHNPTQVDSSETAIVNGTQVANANTGTNAVDNQTDNPPAGSQQPNDIDTGGATAIGSDDTNVVDQQAAVNLTDQAVANLLQVALILNIGAALANSGLNDTVSAPGGNGITGAIDSGNATAVGNDMAQYITQAARANGDENTDDAAKQLAVSLWMGLANANSGINSVTGTGSAGSGGSIGSGDATAIGNQSVTDVLQQAALNGSGTSQLNVEQYATVMNLGFALANSGVNDIAGVAGNLLTAGTSDEQNGLALDLFSMLLPALMQSFVGSGGQGQIGTGDATAIGNRSETYVHQLAEAAASGDGIASIIQDVLVANVGAAGANTGGNVIGGRYASLDPDAAKAVVTLAAFLSQMLALVHTQSAAQALALQDAGMDIPFGDIVLQVKGQLQGYDTQLTGATGQQANIRQITIILSLGIAQANTGINSALGVNQQNALAASVGTALDPTTGDALAANEGQVIICQRRNAQDIECLAPPTTTTPEEPTTTTTTPGGPTTTVPDGPSTTVPGGGGGTPTQTTLPGGPHGFGNPVPQDSSTRGSLPTTGSGVADTLLYAGLVLLLGLVLVSITRRRHPAMALTATVTADSGHVDDLWSVVPPPGE
jgi:LPXTG-motif cell wall-anchored protein